MNEAGSFSTVAPAVLKQLYRDSWRYHLKIPLFYLLLITAGYLAWTTPVWWLRWVMYGCMGYLWMGIVTFMHDCTHGVLFKAAWKNWVFGVFSMIPLVVTFITFKEDHLEHHRYNRSAKDPDAFTMGNRGVLDFVVFYAYPLYRNLDLSLRDYTVRSFVRGDAPFIALKNYQTVFADSRGSIAAPTAGLHFTPPLVAALAARGVDTTAITLHVGYGTFQPVRVERVEDHSVEAERYEISGAVAAAISGAIAAGRRIIAVGTTTTRTLEAVASAHDGAIVAGTGETDLFIYPGFRFRVVNGLMTNFHLPQSSLLMLVSAFAGRDVVRTAYDAAIAERYRFYSYGDSMLIV